MIDLINDLKKLFSTVNLVDLKPGGGVITFEEGDLYSIDNELYMRVNNDSEKKEAVPSDIYLSEEEITIVEDFFQTLFYKYSFEYDKDTNELEITGTDLPVFMISFKQGEEIRYFIKNNIIKFEKSILNKTIIISKVNKND